jgi:sulfate permease, SulP family
MAITNYIRFDNLKGDLFGGLTAAIVSLPLALAFGVASGVGPIAGLYGAICIGFFAALFGGTPTLISEPTGPMTVIMTAVVSSFIAKNPDTGLAMAFTVVMLAGVFQIIFGYFKLGKYITLMPYSVVSGFMSGIGFILIILQIPPFLGQKTPKGGVIGIVQNLPDLISNINGVETGLAIITLGILFFTPKKVKNYIPPQLLALVVGTLLSLFAFPNAEIRTISDLGSIDSVLPTFRLPYFEGDQIITIFVDAVMLGMLGCIDTLLTSLVADSLTRTEHQSDKELIGQGIANIVSGLCGGLPGAGATMGTVVNIKTGAKSALSGLARAVILLVVVLGGAKYTGVIPMAVLAGIAFNVGLGILDGSFLKRAHKISLKGAIIMYGVIALTVFVDLIVAVGVGVFIANILTIDRLSELQSQTVKIITDADDEINLTSEEKYLLDEAKGRILLFYLSGPMIFGVSKAIAREHNAMKQADILILDLSDVSLLGVTTSLAIENAIRDTYEKGLKVFIVGAKGKVRKRLEDLGIVDLISPENFLSSRLEALANGSAIIQPIVNP